MSPCELALHVHRVASVHGHPPVALRSAGLFAEWLGRLLKDEELAQRVSDYFAKGAPGSLEPPKLAPATSTTSTAAPTPKPGTPAPKTTTPNSTTKDIVDPFGRH